MMAVHGLGEHSGRYTNYVAALAPQGYAWYGMDLRGHGRTDGRRGHVKRFGDYLDDLRQHHALIRQWQPNGKLILFGHSLGSLVATTYALRDSVDLAGVILSGMPIRDALNVPRWLRSLAGALSTLAPALTFNHGIQPEELSHDAEVIQAYSVDPLTHSVGSARLAAEVENVRRDLLARAAEWTLPLLMLHGAADPVALPEGAQHFYEGIDRAPVEFRKYEGFYHEPHNELGKEAVFKDVLQWLASIS